MLYMSMSSNDRCLFQLIIIIINKTISFRYWFISDNIHIIRRLLIIFHLSLHELTEEE